VMMDFGQSLKVFLWDEQDAVMDDFEAEYKKSLESIKLLQEVFVSLTIAIAFVMATALLLPIIAGISIEFVVRVSLAGIIIIDVMLFAIVQSFIPADRLCHTLPIKDEGMKKVLRAFYIAAPISIFITMALLYLDFLPFLFNFAIGMSPLLYVGVLAQKHESDIYSKDLAFPSFIRALGSVVEVRLGAVVSSLKSLQVHDFGVLNDLALGLYRRLKLGNDKFKCWMYFAAESGSNLITNFSQIFAESIYLGGDSQKIGEIISKNFSRLLSLRKLRLQLASSVRGAFYGSLVGFASASYVSAKITEILASLFSSPMSGLAGDDNGYMASVISSIAPAAEMDINFKQISMYIGIMILVHCIISALIIKIIDGGNYYAALFDVVLMLWIGAFISWLLPNLIDKMMPDLTLNMNSTELISDS
jgi:flagellar protein FlaJ